MRSRGWGIQEKACTCAGLITRLLSLSFLDDEVGSQGTHANRYEVPRIKCAVQKVIDGMVNDPQILGCDCAPALGMRVTKSGRTTKVTEGAITGVSGVAKIPYGGFERFVRHITHIAKVDESEKVSEAGDSGSWWLEKMSRHAVALHFAGDNDPNSEYGLAVDIQQVLNTLNVDVLTDV